VICSRQTIIVSACPGTPSSRFLLKISNGRQQDGWILVPDVEKYYYWLWYLPARMEMASTLPETPGRGRSRFSKALPAAPRQSSPSSMKSNLRHSPLPPLPKDAMPPRMSIPRRPVGGSKIDHARASSMASVSSVYSDSPGLSRSISDSTNNSRDSLSGGDSEIGPSPPLPLKDEQRQQAAKPAEVSEQSISTVFSNGTSQELRDISRPNPKHIRVMPANFSFCSHQNIFLPVPPLALYHHHLGLKFGSVDQFDVIKVSGSQS